MKRLAYPHEDDVCVQRIEVEFAIPVYIPQSAMRELDGLLSAIVRLKMNQLEGHAHWVSGYGSKPLWSQADARFLGKTPADDAPVSGEPSFDNDVYHIETSCIERRPAPQADKPPCCEGKLDGYVCNCHCHLAGDGAKRCNG